MELAGDCNASCVTPIRIGDVPLYLQGGAFFQSLRCDDPTEVIEVPTDAFKMTCDVHSEEELVHLLRTLRYWMVSTPVASIYLYLLFQTRSVSSILEFEKELPYLSKIRAVKNSKAAGPERSILVESVRWGDVIMLKVAHHQGDQITAEAMELAAEKGELDCLKYMHEQGGECTQFVLWSAVHWGKLACIQFLLSVEAKTFAEACTVAAGEGHLECLTYLNGQGFMLDEHTSTAAAGNGHLPCLQYMRDQGCAWDIGTFAAAAINGHLHILEYLHLHNCPHDEDTMNNAARCGHVECVQYLHEIGHEWDEETTRVAAFHRQVGTLQYLHEQGCPWYYRELVAEAALSNQFAVLEYLEGVNVDVNEQYYF